jgi:hypothetical protein
MTLSEPDRRIMWVRAGGRCTLCKTYLLEGALSAKEVPLGEGAHIVGRVDSEKSPRGKDPLPEADRDDVDNIMLACSSCHTEIDRQKVAGLLDVAFLRTRKRQHEADIKMQTGLIHDRRTAILRMAGDIRGDVMELPRQAAAEAVIRCAERFPKFLESYDRQGVEIDLQRLPGEHPLSGSYYELAKTTIDDAVEHRVIPGIRTGDITHLSVFAIARLPLLIYLGSKLDDGVPVDVFQRHRSTDSWIWPGADAGTEFEVVPPASGEGATEGVLITNLSGITPVGDLPAEVQSLPIWTMKPTTGPAEDLFTGAEVLARYVETVRALFTGLEATHKDLKALHVFGALPLAAAVALGRCLKSSGLRPTLVTYDRAGSAYRPALEI